MVTKPLQHKENRFAKAAEKGPLQDKKENKHPLPNMDAEPDDLRTANFPVQRKAEGVSVSAPDDPSEQEADAIGKDVADGKQVDLGKRTSSFSLQRKGESAGVSVPQGFGDSLSSAKSNGFPIQGEYRSGIEQQMQKGFGDVRVHTDAQADQLSQSINAKAFTHGQDIFFKQGEYRPETKEGKELLAHELVHTGQQSGMVQPMIQRHVDPKENVPNKGDARLTNQEDQGARGYMPLTEQFKASFSAIPDRDSKISLIDNFITEFFEHYKDISDPADNIFQKSLNIKKVAEEVDASNEIRGIPLRSWTTRSGLHLTNSNADWGKFKPLTPEKKWEGYSSMMVLDATANKEAIDLLELKKTDEAAFKLSLGGKIDADVTGDTIASLVTSLRKVGDHVNRLWAVQQTSKKTGMPFSDVMAFYGQESFFTMPSSSGSLLNNIPSPETAGVSIANTEGYYYDFSTMNLTVPHSFGVLSGVGTFGRQLWALLIYSLQVSGSDVVFNVVKGKGTTDLWLDALAGWSVENRESSMDDPGVASSEIPEADEAVTGALKTVLAARWKQVAETIHELSFEHRKASSISGLDEVWVYAPADPADLVSFILTESTFLLKAYQNKPRKLFGSDLSYSSSLAYMMYNSTTNNASGEGYMKYIISSAIRAAFLLAGKPISASGAMTDQFKNELKELHGASDFGSISVWVNAKPERWEMLMNFMEKASQDEWNPKYNGDEKMSRRVNSSNFRTLSEFYQKVMQ